MIEPHNMDLTHYIVSLLNRKGKVLIPGLGGFASYYRPANIDLENHRFSPPSRRLEFSASASGGANLAAEVSRLSGLSEEEADRMVRDFVQQVLQILRQEEPYVFKGMGSLRLVKSGNMVFVPEASFECGDEFLGFESFSMDPVFSEEEMEEEEIPQASEPKPDQDISPAESEEPKETPKEKVKTKRSALVFGWLLAVLGMILLGLAWINKDQVETQVKSLMGKFLTKETPAPIILPEEAPIQAYVADTSTKQDTTMVFSSPDTLPDEEVLPEEPQINLEEGPYYYIVAGAFREEEKAINMVAALKGKGYQSSIFEVTSGGLHVVCYGTYRIREEAESAMARIREKENPSAWLKRVDQ